MAEGLIPIFVAIVAICAAMVGILGALIGRGSRVRNALLGAVVGAAIGVVVAAFTVVRPPQQVAPEPRSDGSAPSGGAHLAIDHVNIAVRYLDQAKFQFEQMGFTTKPGRLHENTIDNHFIKFENGTELELITASSPQDPQAQEYLLILSHGDGPGFFAFRTSTFEMVTQMWERIGLKLRYGQSHYTRSATIFPGQPLRPIWLLDKPEPVIDKKELTTHENTAVKIIGVWFAPYFKNELERFTRGMGLETVAAEHPPTSWRIPIHDGSLFVAEVPMAVKLRPWIGLSIGVRDISAVQKILDTNEIEIFSHASKDNPAIVVAPTAAHGTYLEFRQLDE